MLIVAQQNVNTNISAASAYSNVLSYVESAHLTEGQLFLVHGVLKGDYLAFGKDQAFTYAHIATFPTHTFKEHSFGRPMSMGALEAASSLRVRTSR